MLLSFLQSTRGQEEKTSAMFILHELSRMKECSSFVKVTLYLSLIHI